MVMTVISEQCSYRQSFVGGVVEECLLYAGHPGAHWMKPEQREMDYDYEAREARAKSALRDRDEVGHDWAEGGVQHAVHATRDSLNRLAELIRALENDLGPVSFSEELPGIAGIDAALEGNCTLAQSVFSLRHRVDELSDTVAGMRRRLRL